MTTIESLKRNFDDLSKTFVDIGQEAGNLHILKDFITDILGYASFITAVDKDFFLNFQIAKFFSSG